MSNSAKKNPKTVNSYKDPGSITRDLETYEDDEDDEECPECPTKSSFGDWLIGILGAIIWVAAIMFAWNRNGKKFGLNLIVAVIPVFSPFYLVYAALSCAGEGGDFGSSSCLISKPKMPFSMDEIMDYV